MAAVDRLLDRAAGEPHLLAQAFYARIVKRTITRYDGELYRLDAWVIMHNHVHLLIEPATGISHIARTIMDETEGFARRVLWARESYERAANRNTAEISHWIENHPVRAGLVSRPEAWEWSSAHTDALAKKGPGRSGGSGKKSAAA